MNWCGVSRGIVLDRHGEEGAESKLSIFTSQFTFQPSLVMGFG